VTGGKGRIREKEAAMGRSVRASLWGAAAVGLVAGMLPAAQALSAGSVTAQFVLASDWGTGYEGHYTVTNGSSAAITSWRIEFDLPAGGTMSSFWDADVTHTGNHYVAVSRSYNGTVNPGAGTTWGYVGAGPEPPTNCTVNGAPCAGGGGPTSGPTTGGPTTGGPTTAPTTASPRPSTTTSTTTQPPPPPNGRKLLGYYTEWGIYARNYHVKNVETSGSAAKLTHINYAFGNVTNGGCALGDTYADYDRFYSAAESVDGISDTWDTGVLRGNFGQLRRLKKLHPGLKVIFSFGGWTWSGGFGQAAANASAFANSCFNLVEDPRWADVFDGIDIDWEYPNACGLSCDTSGPAALRTLLAALRSRFGSSALVTAAITADGSAGGKIDAADYAGASQYVDWYNVMTYDYFGAFSPQGPTAPHSPLTSYAGIPTAGFNADAAIGKLKTQGVPANKLLLGIGFYGRGWTGVTQSTPGGTATGPAPGTYEQGIEDYKVLKTSCPSTGTIAGTAYAFCGNNWWSYDTPATIGGKMTYARNQGLGGSFFWELSGDTANGELISAMRGGL
jgi:chitinase